MTDLLKNLVENFDEKKLEKLMARDFMEKNLTTLSESTSIKNAIEIFSIKKLTAACIVNNQFHVLGIISEHDLLIQASSQNIKDKIKYKKEIISASPSDSLKTVLVKILKNKLKSIPVIDSKNHLAGWITRISLLNTIVSHE